MQLEHQRMTNGYLWFYVQEVGLNIVHKRVSSRNNNESYSR
jgi:hypothetical protein